MDPSLQTSLALNVQWDNGEVTRARVLVDTGCETGFLVRLGFAPTGLAYKSSKPLSFVTVNTSVSLSGGQTEVGAVLLAGGGSYDSDGKVTSKVHLRIPVSMYEAGITEWDIMVGHQALYQLCMAHWPRFGLCKLHYPHEPYWVMDAFEGTAKQYQVEQVPDEVHPWQVDVPLGRATRVQQMGLAPEGAGFMLPEGVGPPPLPIATVEVLPDAPEVAEVSSPGSVETGERTAAVCRVNTYDRAYVKQVQASPLPPSDPLDAT